MLGDHQQLVQPAMVARYLADQDRYELYELDKKSISRELGRIAAGGLYW